MAVISVHVDAMSAEQCEALKKKVAERNAPAYLTWGTYGPNGDQPLTVKPLVELDTDHLENILITQPQLSPEYRAAILFLLKQRQNEAIKQLAKDAATELKQLHDAAVVARGEPCTGGCPALTLAEELEKL